MELRELLKGVRVIKLFSLMAGRMVVTVDQTIHAIQYDSRRVGRGDLFVAVRGSIADGHAFIDDAVNSGAIAVVVEDDAALPDSYFMHAGVLKIVVPDSREALAMLSANFYRRPSERLSLIGVTGTNGKTTTTHLIKAILEEHGARVGLVGTIEYRIGDRVIPATHTTPESLELNCLLAEMLGQGCTAAVMEVSSHTLAMKRVHGLRFQAGVFTNLTQDHLDFHGTMEEYLKSKKRLFSGLPQDAWAVTNADDPNGAEMTRGIAAGSVTYGWKHDAAVSARDVSMTINGTALNVAYRGSTYHVESPLTGRFNVSNILAACATGLALGVPGNEAARGIGKVTSVRGRFEQIHAPQGWTAIVDYAHTPDALENCLMTIREIVSLKMGSRVITVFGCGGNRDRGKRPIMGRIASTLSDITIITSDNPRNEDPARIIEEILAGVVPGKTVITEVDRRTAIREALRLAGADDVVLLAGKGHETYQVVGEQKHHFDDREEVEGFLRGSP